MRRLKRLAVALLNGRVIAALGFLSVCACKHSSAVAAAAPSPAPAVTPAPSPVVWLPGKIVALRLSGAVQAVADGQTIVLKEGDALPPKATITTSANSSVVLALSNGARLKLPADTTLEVKEFLQQPFPDSFDVDLSETEPSVSRTALRLVHGEIIGVVKRLLHASGSSFTVDTPAGAAGIVPPNSAAPTNATALAVPPVPIAPAPISPASAAMLRGAAGVIAPNGGKGGPLFRIVFRPTGTGQALFSLTALTGGIQLTPLGGGSGAKTVDAGQEMVIVTSIVR